MLEKGMRDVFYKAKIILKHIWRDTFYSQSLEAEEVCWNEKTVTIV